MDQILSIRKPILITPRYSEEESEKETVEIVVDKAVNVLVHASGIRVEGPSTEINIGLGLSELRSDNKRTVKVFKLDEGLEVGRVIIQMDGF